MLYLKVFGWIFKFLNKQIYCLQIKILKDWQCQGWCSYRATAIWCINCKLKTFCSIVEICIAYDLVTAAISLGKKSSEYASGYK